MRRIDLSGDRGALLAAAIGSAGALVLALFVNALLLLAVEAVALGGAYAYSKASKHCGNKTGAEVIDAEYKEV